MTTTVTVPTRAAISKMTDDELVALDDALEAAGDADGIPDADDATITFARCAVEMEQDARAAWSSGDDRVRESVGNYRSHLS